MSRGVKMGRRPKLTANQRSQVAKRLVAGESTRNLARDFGVSHATVARVR
jgi:FixJ family two-component response regulator